MLRHSVLTWTPQRVKATLSLSKSCKIKSQILRWIKSWWPCYRISASLGEALQGAVQQWSVPKPSLCTRGRPRLPQGPGSPLRKGIWPPAYGRGLSDPWAWKQLLGFLCSRNRVTHYTATSVVLGRMDCLKQNLGQGGRKNLWLKQLTS